MESLPLIKKQVLILFVFSVLMSAGMIVHGVYFDLNMKEIGRLTLEGLLFTVIIIYPAILFIEWVFDMNNKKKFDSLERRIFRLEKLKR